MLAMIIFLVVLSVISLWVCSRFLHDPYRDIQAPEPYDVEIPDLTFDARGLA